MSLAVLRCLFQNSYVCAASVFASINATCLLTYSFRFGSSASPPTPKLAHSRRYRDSDSVK